MDYEFAGYSDLAFDCADLTEHISSRQAGIGYEAWAEVTGLAGIGGEDQRRFDVSPLAQVVRSENRPPAVGCVLQEVRPVPSCPYSRLARAARRCSVGSPQPPCPDLRPDCRRALSSGSAIRRRR